MKCSLDSALDREEEGLCPKDSFLQEPVGALPETQSEAEVCEDRLMRGQERTQALQDGGEVSHK